MFEGKGSIMRERSIPKPSAHAPGGSPRSRAQAEKTETKDNMRFWVAGTMCGR